jgi:hypothetical protein
LYYGLIYSSDYFYSNNKDTIVDPLFNAYELYPERIYLAKSWKGINN